MPWELGWSDAFKQKVAILPILQQNIDTEIYEGQEYLGLYPYVVRNGDINGSVALYIHESKTLYTGLRRWLDS
jgi:hypothetical protein